jgi:hypothetical protein
MVMRRGVAVILIDEQRVHTRPGAMMSATEGNARDYCWATVSSFAVDVARREGLHAQFEEVSESAARFQFK